MQKLLSYSVRCLSLQTDAKRSKIAVAAIVGQRGRTPTREFLRLASHFLFAYRFCRVRRPNEKGHVEAMVKFARSNFLVPVPRHIAPASPPPAPAGTPATRLPYASCPGLRPGGKNRKRPAGLDAIPVEVHHSGEIKLGGDARCLAARLTHRSRHHAGSRCPALRAAALPQGPVVLHEGRPARPHPPVVRVRRVGTGGRLTRPRRGAGKRHSPPLLR